MPWFSASSDVQQVHLHVVASDNDLEALWARQPQAARRNTLRFVLEARPRPLPPMKILLVIRIKDRGEMRALSVSYMNSTGWLLVAAEREFPQPRDHPPGEAPFTSSNKYTSKLYVTLLCTLSQSGHAAATAPWLPTAAWSPTDMLDQTMRLSTLQRVNTR